MIQRPSKRPRVQSDHDGTMDPQSPMNSSPNPYLPMFETFRAELDAHHDRRERVVKASRDVTASSKKIIFSLQRVRSYGSPLPPSTAKDIKPFEDICESNLQSLVPDLQGMNAWRYQRQISPGIQELMEALIFSHYLQHQNLLGIDQARSLIPQSILLTEEDWMGGVMDSIGECMRWAITGMATLGEIPGRGRVQLDEPHVRDVVQDMRELRAEIEALRTQGSSLERDLHKKMDVMKTCVNKIETSAYSLLVRGKERPKGWVPDVREDDKPAPNLDR